MIGIERTYRVSLILLIAALLMFLLGDEIAGLLADPSATLRERGGGRGDGNSSPAWIGVTMYGLAGGGLVLLVAAAITEAWIGKNPPV